MLQPDTLKRNFLNVKQVNVESHLTCALCLEIFMEPYRINCGYILIYYFTTIRHTFCKQCIINSLSFNKSCPNCRKEVQISSLTKDLIADNIINDLGVSCNFQS